MSLRQLIVLRRCGVVLQSSSIVQWRVPSLFLLAAVLVAIIPVQAKDSPLNAIALFDGSKGVVYVQITGLTINGKTELRVCDGVPRIDRRNYETLPRIQMAGAVSLWRGTDGVLTLSIQGKLVCVVPSNLRFDAAPEVTPAQAAEQTLLQGVLVPSSPSEPAQSLPRALPGLELIFVPAPDVELAEYLRAKRANSAADWQEFVTRFPSSTYAARARNSLAEAHERAAEAALTQYQKTAAARTPDLAVLKQAYTEAQDARQAVAGYGPAVKLVEAAGRELDTLCEQDKAELVAFQRALQDHAAGVSHLTAAKQHVELLLAIQPDHAALVNLRRAIGNEQQKLDAAVANAESLLAAKRYDEAVTSLGPYEAFAGEMPRINAVLSAGYEYHFNRGRELAAQQDWEQATAELGKAVTVRPTSQEATAALKIAITQQTATRNQQTVDRALAQSKEYSGKGDVIEAYNTLARLPEAQRALVTSQLSALAHDYVAAAVKRAQRLQDTHVPIKGRADEEAVREAFDLLDRASVLSGDPAVKLKRDFLSGKISAYYIDLAKRYLDKPLGSGVGMGWLYLKEAQRYDTNLGIVKDQLKDLMATYAPVYQRRARLSIGIVLRDQTSRRNSVGFADQMADAIANGLEPSGVPVEVVRRPPETRDATSPNFVLVGEILEHRVVKNANLETLPSKYRAGTHEVKNPAWLQANADYEAAKQELASVQHALTDAQAQHKKKELLTAAADAVQQAQQHADELRHKLETTDQSRVETVVEPYQYTRKTVDLTASIDLAFRVNDQSGSVVEPTVSLHKDNHKAVAVLENVKPEDTEGITNKSVEPDEGQFLTDLEIEARNALVKAVRDKASELPGKILREARGRVQRGDVDGAAEEFVLYLNSTQETPSPEREEAAKFLHDQFSLTVSTGAKP